jgi:hypothetical protein
VREKLDTGTPPIIHDSRILGAPQPAHGCYRPKTKTVELPNLVQGILISESKIVFGADQVYPRSTYTEYRGWMMDFGMVSVTVQRRNVRRSSLTPVGFSEDLETRSFANLLARNWVHGNMAKLKARLPRALPWPLRPSRTPLRGHTLYVPWAHGPLFQVKSRHRSSYAGEDVLMPSYRNIHRY